MACDGSHYHDNDMEITYRSRIFPHPEYKFDIDNSKKRGRARVLLHQILGWEIGYYVCEEVRHHVVTHVKEYHDIYFFLNYLSEVWRCKDEIPDRYHGYPTSMSKFEYFCETVEDTTVDRARHFPSPVGAHMHISV